MPAAQQHLLEALANDAEPTWLLVKEASAHAHVTYTTRVERVRSAESAWSELRTGGWTKRC